MALPSRPASWPRPRIRCFCLEEPGTLSADLPMDAHPAAPGFRVGLPIMAWQIAIACLAWRYAPADHEMGEAPDDQPITPHAGPLRDPSGLLSYIGDDGRRYVVGSPADLQAVAAAREEPPLPDAASAERVMHDLRQANRLYRRIESLCRDWIAAVQSRDLERGAAMDLLLATLETTLEEPDSETEPAG